MELLTEVGVVTDCVDVAAVVPVAAEEMCSVGNVDGMVVAVVVSAV